MNKTQLNSDKFLTGPEVEHLAKVLRENPGRDALILETLLKCGARASELLALKVSDLTSSGTLKIKGLKNSNDREVLLPKELVERLRVRTSGRPQDELIFGIKYSRLDQIWRMYRPTKKSLHSLRHTFAIRLYKKSQDIRLVKYCLGHKKLETSMIYLEYSYSASEQRKYLYD